MTDQLEPEAEARIREACGCSTCVGEMRCGPWRCKADDLRAFLKADREAREIKCEVCNSTGTILITNGQGGPVMGESACPACGGTGFSERAHADALAEALRSLRNHGTWSHDALTCGHPNEHLATGSHADETLAAHDKLRGR